MYRDKYRVSYQWYDISYRINDMIPSTNGGDTGNIYHLVVLLL